MYGSETVTQTQDASMPYLSPINMATLPDYSSAKNEAASQPITERQNKSPQTKKKKKKGVNRMDSTQTDNINRDSVALLEPAQKS